MSTRDEMVDAIQEFANATGDWVGAQMVGAPVGPRPQVEDYVGHLLPDADGVPAGMEVYGVIESAGVDSPDHDLTPFTLYRFRPVPTEPAAEPVDNHAYGSYKPEWDGPAVPSTEETQ